MKSLSVLVRVVLTVLLILLGLKVGITLAPRLARFGAGSGVAGALGFRGTSGYASTAATGSAQPDWGGGRLSFPVRSAKQIVDSARSSFQPGQSKSRVYSGPIGGVVLEHKSGSDYALTLAFPSPGQPDRSAVFELPSTGRFRKELLPGPEDAEPPAPDIPLYPKSVCRTQVGRGTGCFVGFYLTPDGVETVRSYYVRQLGRLGWQRVSSGRAGLLETFAKRSEDRMVVVQLKEQDSVTTRIGMVAMTSGGSSRSKGK